MDHAAIKFYTIYDTLLPKLITTASVKFGVYANHDTLLITTIDDCRPSRSSSTLLTVLPKGLVPRSLIQLGVPLMKTPETVLSHHTLDLDVASTLDHHASGDVDICILSHNLTVVKRRE